MRRSVGRLVVSVGLAVALLCVAVVGTAWAAPPSNDTRENATLIPALPFTHTVDTTEATAGPEDAAICPLPTPVSHSVWYRYTSPSNHAVVIDTAGSSYTVWGILGRENVGTSDSCVALFAGLPPAGPGVFSAQAGQTYWIVLVDVPDGTGGSLQLSVDTTNPEYGLPETVVSGRARLSGPSGCVYRAFRASVTGRRIASVRFFVDGRLVKRIDERRRTYTVRVRPKGLGLGFHRVTARVRFVGASKTAPRTLRLTFRRCARQTVSPRFTG
jgi:hypothetical protein